MSAPQPAGGGGIRLGALWSYVKDQIVNQPTWDTAAIVAVLSLLRASSAVTWSVPTFTTVNGIVVIVLGFLGHQAHVTAVKRAELRGIAYGQSLNPATLPDWKVNELLGADTPTMADAVARMADAMDRVQILVRPVKAGPVEAPSSPVDTAPAGGADELPPFITAHTASEEVHAEPHLGEPSVPPFPRRPDRPDPTVSERRRRP